jgi:hypothetical protein
VDDDNYHHYYKGKVPMLKEAPCFEDVLGSGGIVARIL